MLLAVLCMQQFVNCYAASVDNEFVHQLFGGIFFGLSIGFVGYAVIFSRIGCSCPNNLFCDVNAIVIIRFFKISSVAKKFPPKMFIDVTWYNVTNVCGKKFCGK